VQHHHQGAFIRSLVTTHLLFKQKVAIHLLFYINACNFTWEMESPGGEEQVELDTSKVMRTDRKTTGTDEVEQEIQAIESKSALLVAPRAKRLRPEVNYKSLSTKGKAEAEAQTELAQAKVSIQAREIIESESESEDDDDDDDDDDEVDDDSGAEDAVASSKEGSVVEQDGEDEHEEGDEVEILDRKANTARSVTSYQRANEKVAPAMNAFDILKNASKRAGQKLIDKTSSSFEDVKEVALPATFSTTDRVQKFTATTKSRAEGANEADRWIAQFFIKNPSFEKGETQSHLCKFAHCQAKLSLFKFIDEQGKPFRAQKTKARDHVRLKHSRDADDFQKLLDAEVAAKRESAKSFAKKADEDAAALSQLAHKPISKSELALTKLSDVQASLFNLDYTRDLHKRLLAEFSVFVAQDGLPQSAGEKAGFQRFMKTIGLPSRIKFDHRSVSKYQDLVVDELWGFRKQALATEIKFSPRRFSVSLDGWSRDGLQLIGGVLTYVSYVRTTFEQVTLGLIEVKGNASAEAISKAADELLVRVGLARRHLYACTNDNASTARAASRLLSAYAQNCYSHKAKLVLDDNVGKVPDAKDDASVIYENADKDPAITPSRVRFPVLHRIITGAAAWASHFNRSPLAQSKFGDFQVSKMVPNPEGAIIYAKTRWTGLFECLRQHSKLVSHCRLGDFLSNYSSDKVSRDVVERMQVKAGDDRVLQLLVAILFPLYLFTKESEEESFSLATGYLQCLDLWGEYSKTTSAKMVDDDGYIMKKMTLPHIGEVTVHHLEALEQGGELSSFKAGLASSIKSRFVDDEFNDEVLLALCLDPRSRSRLRAFESVGVLRVQAQLILERMDAFDSRVIERMREFKDLIQGEETESSGVVAADSVVEVDDDGIDSIPDAILQAMTVEQLSKLAEVKRLRISAREGVTSVPEADSVEKQWNAAKVAMQASTSDDLTFWKHNSRAFPLCYHLFLQVRCIRPSTARLESVFSLADNQVPDERACMTNRRLDARLILKTSKIASEIVDKAIAKVADPGRPTTATSASTEQSTTTE
jgi:hAT family C-terminal dimerisation region